MRSEIPVALNPAYAALVERGALSRAGARMRDYVRTPALTAVITSPRVRSFWGAALEQSLAEAELRYGVFELPDGEQYKNLASVRRLAEALVEAGADRDCLVVAFGGGVVGDVGGLLASVYMRGVALLQIPTTLLAMVDSSLGGKTGVNLIGGKNLVGTFYHPLAIVADPAVLATLPEREYRSGLAEAVKYGIIGAPQLFEFIESNAAALRRQEPELLESLIASCLREKAAVVIGDERDQGRRQALNFGHTIGHALESVTGYQRYLHGEAVAWGMIAVARLAVRLGRLSDAEAARMIAVILAACAPLPTLAEDPALVLRHAASDKKAHGGQLRFLLPLGIGRVEITAGIAESEILAAITEAALITAPA
ncbi:MAG: 3-dehydroquinate synthase [Terriglobales bacterium]